MHSHRPHATSHDCHCGGTCRFLREFNTRQWRPGTAKEGKSTTTSRITLTNRDLSLGVCENRNGWLVAWGFLWVNGFSFFHCVASPFHSFVTTETSFIQHHVQTKLKLVTV